MIVDFPGFASMNRLADLAGGTYLVVESTYRLGGSLPRHAVLSEIACRANVRSVGADLQVVLHDGTLLFRDFAMARDGAWRDSYGRKSSALADLLPPELMGSTLVERRCILVIHDGQGGLSLPSGLELSDGP